MNSLPATDGKQLIYVGTYTHLPNQPNRSESIYIYAFDSSSGKLDFQSVVHDVVNPSFLTISKDRQFLFAVNEVDAFSGISGGAVSAFAIDPESAHLSLINAQPTHGASPCYVTLDATEKWAFVTNYMGGSIAVFPVADDGRLGEATAVIQNQGYSINPTRQEAPHPHSIVFDPTQRYAFVADLGLDQILIFRFDAASGQLLPHDPPAFVTEPGAGPRHLEFHPNSRYLYVSNELNSTVTVYTCDLEHGALKHQQTISAVPDDFVGINWIADIHVMRSGLFLYVSNRGHDSIAVFAINQQDGSLTLVETVSSGGQTPRNFSFDLNDSFLLVANQDSHNLIVFQMDKSNGRLTPTTSAISIPSPVCVQVVDVNIPLNDYKPDEA